MNNFIVSARKYRPLKFSSVVGQDFIVTTLKNAIKNNQVAQSFLFCGPRGVGKTTCARILAKTINCMNLTSDYEACNECPSCKAFNENSSFNIHELDAASNNSVEDIRALIDQVRIAPQLGKYKIYIIDEVHMLSTAAFNAFLKTLEEPPSYAKFILATTEKHKILPTIISRCQVFDFKRISIEDIAKHLAWVAKQENVNAEYEALHIIAKKADGALRDALSMFDQLVSFTGNNLTYNAVVENLNILDYEVFFNILNLILKNDLTGIFNLINDIYERGFEGQSIIDGLSEHLRNLLLAKDPLTHHLMNVPNSVQKEFQNQAKQFSANFIVKALDIVSQSDLSYKSSSNKRFLVELTLLKITNLLNETSKKTEVEEKKNDITQEKKQPEKKTEIRSPYPKEENSQKENPSIVAQPFDNLYVSNILNTDTSNKKIEDKQFSFDDFHTAFQEYINDLTENKQILKNILQDVTIKQVNETHFQLITGSQLNFEEIKQSNIQDYLREKLQNTKIKLELILEKKEEIRQPSREEKINEIINSTPQLQKFINDLELKIE